MFCDLMENNALQDLVALYPYRRLPSFINMWGYGKWLTTFKFFFLIISIGELKIENMKCSKMCHYTSCNYRKNYFSLFIFLLLSFPQSQLQNIPKQCTTNLFINFLTFYRYYSMAIFLRLHY